MDTFNANVLMVCIWMYFVSEASGIGIDFH